MIQLFLFMFLLSVYRSAAVVDEHKLMWLNSQHFAMQCQNSDKMTKFVNQLRKYLLKNQDFR